MRCDTEGGPRILSAGSRALLIAPDEPARIGAWASALRDSGIAGVSDVLPAAQTILVTTEAGVDLRSLERLIRGVVATADDVEDAGPDDSAVIPIPVCYKGDDLDDVASLLGVSVDDVIAEHTNRTWTCAFVGFAPGFGYLRPDRPGMAVPRRARARTSVPPGAVALADGYSAIYPRRSPGGWRIIGRTTEPVWDIAASQPALIRPGQRVQFIAESIR